MLNTVSQECQKCWKDTHSTLWYIYSNASHLATSSHSYMTMTNQTVLQENHYHQTKKKTNKPNLSTYAHRECPNTLIIKESITWNLESQNIKGLEWTLKIIYSQPPAMGRNSSHKIRLFKALSNLALNSARVGAFTTSLHNLLLSNHLHSEKIFLNIEPSFSSYPLILVLSAIQWMYQIHVSFTHMFQKLLSFLQCFCEYSITKFCTMSKSLSCSMLWVKCVWFNLILW